MPLVDAVVVEEDVEEVVLIVEAVVVVEVVAVMEVVVVVTAMEGNVMVIGIARNVKI